MEHQAVMALRDKTLDEAEWFPVALVLLCEDRVCKGCSRVHRTPNPQLMIRVVNPLYKSLKSRLVLRSNWPHDIQDLAHELEVETTSCARCHFCFNGEPDGQLLMFPRKLRRIPTLADILAKKREELGEENERNTIRLARTDRSKKKLDTVSKAQQNRIKAKSLFGDL